MDYYVPRYGSYGIGKAYYWYRSTYLEICDMVGYDVFHPFF